MKTEIKNLQPQPLWKHFANINAIPRPSNKEQKLREFIQQFCTKLNLSTQVDEVGNLIVKKPASKGMEMCKTVALQAHLDMVCQKNEGTDFDFDTQGINMLIEGDWVTADGTTLGADNGIGVAAIMSVLESTEMAHPAIEALFTVNEEAGMSGAKGLKPGLLQAEIMLNLDTEDDEEIAMGCAGGIDITATKSYESVPVVAKHAYNIRVKGLNGGHSGIDINHGYGNANKILNRILYALKQHIRIAEIEAGSLRNAIPREAKALIVTDDETHIDAIFAHITAAIKEEYAKREPQLKIYIETTDIPQSSLNQQQSIALIQSIYTIHNGVFRMSADMHGLVETSNNLARIVVNNGEIKIMCLTRSATETGKFDMANHIQCGLEMAGYAVKLSGSYPGWKPNPHSKILSVLENIYAELFHAQPKIIAYHAGLECGIIGANYPHMDMISFGPSIQRAHSPDEKACISSTLKFWQYLTEILKNIPNSQA